MRSCRYLGQDFCAAYGLQFSIYVQRWSLMAESAEHGAEAELTKRAQRTANARGR
jgi:hypothetical protein